MPQLEQIDTFVSQVFWLAITFAILYLVLWRAALPRVADILRDRQERVDNDLRRAEELKKEAQSVLESYEAAVEKGHAEARSLLRETSERLAQEAAERQDVLSERIGAEAEEAEARIDAARRDALSNMQSLATEIAQAAAGRLLDAEISRNDAETAVEATLKERG